MKFNSRIFVSKMNRVESSFLLWLFSEFSPTIQSFSFKNLFCFFFYFWPDLLSVFFSNQKAFKNVKLSTTKVFSKEWQSLYFFRKYFFFAFFLVWKLVEGFGRLPLDGLAGSGLDPVLPHLVGIRDEMVLKNIFYF